MTKDKAYELLDKAISELADDFWDDETTTIKNVGYLLGYADGIGEAVKENNNDVGSISLIASGIEETLCNIARNNALIFTEEEQDAIAEAILAMQELEWYRKQNLIRREDAKNAMPFDSTELFNRLLSYLEEIPKAAPPKEKL